MSTFVFSDEDHRASKLAKEALAGRNMSVSSLADFTGNPHEAVCVFTTNKHRVPNGAHLVQKDDPFEVPDWAKGFGKQIVTMQFSEQYFENFGDDLIDSLVLVASK